MAETKSRKKPVAKIFYVLLILALLATGAYLYKQNRDLKNKKTDTQAAAQQEQDETIAAVKKLYVFPADKPDAVVKITDKASCDFKNVKEAQNGDYVLEFKNENGRVVTVVVYRRNENKIVAFEKVTLPYNVKLVGDAAGRQSAQQTLASVYKSAVVVKQADAKSPHAELLVVDVSGKNAEAAQQIAETLKAKVGSLPAGEDKPNDADIVVIIPSATPAQ